LSSGILRPTTASFFVSNTVSVGFVQPLLVTTRKRPSGDITMLSGRSPIITFFPAGAIRHPFGSNVAPLGWRPGHATGTAPRCASAPTMPITQVPSINNAATPRRVVFVPVRNIAADYGI
jgi:hypothetical protein